MKKRLNVAIALFAAILLLAGCASSKETAPTTAQLQALVAADGEVAYIFAQAGLPVDGKRPVKDAQGNLYFPVESDKYKGVKELEALLKSTYALEDTVNTLLATPDANGAPLYAELEGRLCRSASPLYSGGGATLDAKTIKAAPPQKGEDGKQIVTFAVDKLVAEQPAGKVNLIAVEVKGGWRLSATGQGSPNPADAAVGEGDAAMQKVQQVAQQFLDALVARDKAQVQYLTITEADAFSGWGYSYSFVEDSGVTAATLEETLAVDEVSGIFRVTIAAEGGNGAFKAGSNSYQLSVSASYTADETSSPFVVSALTPTGSTPYRKLPFDEQTNRALNQVSRLINLHGMVQFQSPRELDGGLLTEYLLYELAVASPDSAERGYTLEEVQAMGEKLLGTKGFAPEQQFFNTESSSYMLWGRGIAPPPYSITQLSEGDGVITIEALAYSDPLWLLPTARIVYTLKNNWNGTYELVSGALTNV